MFSDVIMFTDFNLNDSIPRHPIQPVYIKHAKVLCFFIFPTGKIRVSEIRFASTGIICGNPYPVCKKNSYCAEEELIHFQGDPHLSKLFLLLSEKGSTLKGKNLLPLESLEQNPFQKGVGVQESKQEARNVVYLLKNGGNSTKCILLASVAQLDAPSDWRPGGHGFNPCNILS